MVQKKLTFKQLRQTECIAQARLEQIAGLIYDTDAYIYPCIFNSRADAVRVISRLISQGADAMFRAENLFVAELENNIAAIVLWKRGSLSWSSTHLRAAADEARIELSQFLEKAEDEYFTHYASVGEVTSVINVCVAADLRGHGVGGALMREFIRHHVGEKMELFVLEDNISAIRLYAASGFCVTERLNGFSEDGRDLPCLKMEKLGK